MSKTSNGRQIKSKKNNNKKKTSKVQTIKNTAMPTSFGITSKAAKPQMSQRGKIFTIRNIEYIGEVSGSASVFSISNSIPIQPGLPASFPWLSSIANRFESYRFRSLRYHFRPSVPTTDAGFAILAPDYDAADAPPTSKVQVLAYQDHSRSPIWQSNTMVSSSENLSKRNSYFTRSTSLSSALDLNLYDVGNLYVITGGNTALGSQGELHVEYEIDLHTPQLEASPVSGDRISGLAAMTNNVPLGLGPQVLGTDPVVNYTTTPTASLLTFLKPYSGIVSTVANYVAQPTNVATTGPWVHGGTTPGLIANTIYNQFNATAAATATQAVESILVNANVGDILTYGLSSTVAFPLANSVVRFGDYSVGSLG